MKIHLNFATGINLWFMGMLFFPFALRKNLFSLNIASLNLIAIIGLLIILKLERFKKADLYGKIITICVLCAISLHGLNFNSISNLMQSFFAIYIPIILLKCDRLPSQDYKDYAFRSALKFFNVAAYILFVSALIDLTTGFRLSALVAKFYNTATVLGLASSHRLVSIYGHSLVSMTVAISYYILNIVDFMIYKEHNKKPYVSTVITAVIIASTGSKTGLFAFIALTFICYVSTKGLKYFPILIVCLFAAWYAGLFDFTISRINAGLEVGDISTGRFSTLLAYIQSGQLKFYWIKGHGTEYDFLYRRIIAALENPILRWSYKYGVVYALCMTVATMILPFLKIIKRNFRIGLLAAVFIFVINSYDTLCSIGDSMLLYCSVSVLMMMAASYELNKEFE